jgi:formylglycine-generating enzyme
MEEPQPPLEGGLCVSKVVTIRAGSTQYGIDATEVTRGQYADWLSTTTSATINSQDPATCDWNTSFDADAGCLTNPDSATSICQGATCSNHPQVCVDWCDAAAYCRSVNKRLCGNIGGGASSLSEAGNATSSQWYAACSSGGGLAYPYGNGYIADACNGRDYWGGDTASNWTTTPVGYLSTCQALVPYSGVFDMSGNVMEWEDSCDGTTPGRSAHCLKRGGSWGSYWDMQNCLHVEANATRVASDDQTGFRCCSNP